MEEKSKKPRLTSGAPLGDSVNGGSFVKIKKRETDLEKR